jgi:hypothetical protein
MVPMAPPLVTSGGEPPAKAMASTTRQERTFLAKGVFAVNRGSRWIFRTIRPGSRAPVALVGAVRDAGGVVRVAGAAEWVVAARVDVVATRSVNKAGTLEMEGTHIKLFEVSKTSSP